MHRKLHFKTYCEELDTVWIEHCSIKKRIHFLILPLVLMWSWWQLEILSRNFISTHMQRFHFKLFLRFCTCLNVAITNAINHPRKNGINPALKSTRLWTHTVNPKPEKGPTDRGTWWKGVPKSVLRISAMAYRHIRTELTKNWFLCGLVMEVSTLLCWLGKSYSLTVR